MTRWRHSGDYGDCVIALALVHAHGDTKNAFYLTDRPGVTSPMSPRCKPLLALIEAQPYITEALMSEKSVDCDFVDFRHFHGSTSSLLQSHLKQYQLETGKLIKLNGSQPWLFADPAEESKGRIVIAHSPRYNNDSFPWKAIVRHYGGRLLFVGHPDEHKAFVGAFGWVKHITTKTLLDVAQLIAGAELCIMNQSSPLNIAIGLGVPFIEEVCLDQPDCLYPRANAQYVADGHCVLPDIDGSGVLETHPPQKDISHFSRSLVPPGLWQYPGLPDASNFDMQKVLVARLKECDNADADEILMRFNINRVPNFFTERGSNPLEKFQTAYKKAFGEQKPQLT